MRMEQWIRRLWYLVNRRRLERELEREMTAHRAQMSEPRRFGNTRRLREEAADVWGWAWLDDVSRDIRHGVRQLVRARGFAATAILTLALGIGANTAIFSVFNSLLLRKLPVQDPDRLVVLGDTVREATSWSYPVWEQIRSRSDLFDGAFASTAERLNLVRGGEAQFVEGLLATGEFFDVLGVRAAVGRTFTIQDDRRGGGPDGPVAVISHDFWQRQYGASPAALGQSLTLDAVAFTIVGVTPPDFFGTNVGQRFDVAIPLGTEPLLRGVDSSVGIPTRNWLSIMLRIRSDQTIDETTAAMRGLQPQIREAVFGGLPQDLRAVILKEPFRLTSASRGRSTLRDRYSLALVVLLSVVGLVLLIACVNIANLMLARSVARRHEMSVRIAIGASRIRLVRMLTAEAFVLALFGAVLGVGVSRWLGPLLVRQLSTWDSIVSIDLTLDWRVLLFTAVVSVTMTALFAAAPAWHSARLSQSGTLGDQSRGRVSGRRSPLTASLVSVQLALSLVLIVGAGLFIRTFAGLASQDFGFTANRVLVVEVTAPMTRYTLPRLVSVYERVREAVAAVPGVERAALSDITPVGGSSRNAFIDVPGAETMPRGERLIMVNVVSPEWFGTYGTAVLAGRDFAPTDAPNTSPVAVVNQAFARRFLKGVNPVGHTVGLSGPAKTRFEIIGLVEDAVYRSVREPAPPTMYTSTMQRAAARPFAKVSVLSAADSPARLTRAIAAAIQGVAPDLTLQFTPLAVQVDAAMTQERLVALLSGFFGTLALLLASIGLYGVTAYGASRRRAEIGVRLALGAGRSGVVRLVMRGIMWPIAGGVVAGAVLSFWLAQFVGALTWGLAPRDPLTFVGAATILVVVAAAAGWVPAWRASRLDPVAALRQ